MSCGTLLLKPNRYVLMFQSCAPIGNRNYLLPLKALTSACFKSLFSRVTSPTLLQLRIEYQYGILDTSCYFKTFQDHCAYNINMHFYWDMISFNTKRISYIYPRKESQWNQNLPTNPSVSGLVNDGTVIYGDRQKKRKIKFCVTLFVLHSGFVS